ncbi:hypothetical protein FSP39_022374 [Pinctada imbricata]|uniref:CWH43-like N-terminal domain-containing protein n=1 Tax=Pinctada imbricata TaxID=66713 RepID=A0AA88Y9J8_PINIB|nr:hypothetical protein FSP39_022374 [Pinctada imbricata]
MDGRSSGMNQKELVKVNFGRTIVVESVLPFCAAIFCVVWSLVFDFESCTWTHCKVPNYLPSISSAIGGYTPQRYVWRLCIGLHAAPRFMIAAAYYSYHTQFHVGKRNDLYRTLSKLCILLHVVENFALVGLTYISSIENHGVHENLFIIFMLCSQVYMLITCIIYRWGHQSNGRIMSLKETKSLRMKTGLFIFNVVIFLLAVYLFFRHNSHCEPGVYTMFAAAEYLTVFSNIAFHYTASYDFSDCSISICPDAIFGKTVHMNGGKQS